MPVWKRIQFAACLTAVISLSALAHAKDLKINIPKRSQLMPVQRLNREGVEAVNKHQFNKAKAVVYKAYLYDPGDPFTLNNLGYIASWMGRSTSADFLLNVGFRAHRGADRSGQFQEVKR